jgi:hypothetical protein
VYPESVGERTRELKLEWERRLALESERLLPTISIELVAMELVGIPMKKISIGAKDSTDIEPVLALYNLHDGSFLEPLCPSCGKRSRILTIARDGKRVVCKSCFACT